MRLETWIFDCYDVYFMSTRSQTSASVMYSMLPAVSKMSSTFKVVGVPEENDFLDSKEFPFYTDRMIIGGDGKKKRYRRGVEKALCHMLKTRDGNADDYSGLISLIDGMLHLDPKERISADEALGHQYMLNHSANIEKEEFHRQYVMDWLALKENVLSKGTSSKYGKHHSYVGSETSTPPSQTSQAHGNGEELKRKAFLIGASSGGGEDDLYNLDDIIGATSSKKSKFSGE